jgi:membrane associated rhomboid family serine protease
MNETTIENGCPNCSIWNNLDETTDNNEFENIELIKARREYYMSPIRKPLFTSFLILSVIFFFVYGIISTRYSKDAIILGEGSTGFPNNLNFEYILIDNFPTCKDMRMDLWRLISYQFEHISLLHILGNFIGLLFYGSMLESFIESYNGRLQTIIAYELSVIIGILGEVYTDGYRSIIGCSMGVYGLIGLSTNNVLSGGLKSFARSILFIILILQMVGDILYFTVFYNPNVTYAGHFTGYITGFVVGNAFYIFSDKNKWNKIDFVFCIFGVAVGAFETIFLVYHYIVDFPPKFNINPTFDKPYLRNNCCLDAYNLVNSQSMTMDYIKSNYNCINNILEIKKLKN